MNINQAQPHRLAVVLRALMQHKGIPSDNELADRMDAFENGQFSVPVSQPTISRIVNGKTKNPKVETLLRIARFFDVTEAQLRGLEEIPYLALSEPGTQKVQQDPAAYDLVPEATARECVGLIAAWARLPKNLRETVRKLTHQLRTGLIDNQTPLYSLEDVQRCVQATLFYDGAPLGSTTENDKSHIISGITELLVSQKSHLVSRRKRASSKSRQNL